MEASRIPAYLEPTESIDPALADYINGLRGRVQEMREQRLLPTDDDQIILIRRMQIGNGEAVRELIHSNAALIKFVLRDYYRESPIDSETAQLAVHSTISSARRFNPYRHGPFAEYAAEAIVVDLQERSPQNSKPTESAEQQSGRLNMLWDIAKTNRAAVSSAETETEQKAEAVVLQLPERPAAQSVRRKPRRKASPVTIKQIQKDLPMKAVPSDEVPKPSNKSNRQRKESERTKSFERADSLAGYRSRPIPRSMARSLAARAEEGDAQAKETLIRSMLGATLSIAARHRDVAEFDDLVQESALALVKAVNRYKNGTGAVFSFAYPRMRGAVIDHLRHEDSVRGVSRRNRRNGDSSKIAFSLDDSDFDVSSNEDLEGNVIDRLYHIERWEVVQEALERLRPFTREAVELRHGLGDEPELESWSELGERLGISESGALLRYKKAIKELALLMEVQTD